MRFFVCFSLLQENLLRAYLKYKTHINRSRTPNPKSNFCPKSNFKRSTKCYVTQKVREKLFSFSSAVQISFQFDEFFDEKFTKGCLHSSKELRSPVNLTNFIDKKLISRIWDFQLDTLYFEIFEIFFPSMWRFWTHCSTLISVKFNPP